MFYTTNDPKSTAGYYPNSTAGYFQNTTHSTTTGYIPPAPGFRDSPKQIEEVPEGGIPQVSYNDKDEIINKLDNLERMIEKLDNKVDGLDSALSEAVRSLKRTIITH